MLLKSDIMMLCGYYGNAAFKKTDLEVYLDMLLPVQSSWFCEKVQDTLQSTGLWGTGSWWASTSPALILLQDRDKLISRVSLFSTPDGDTIEPCDANSSVLSRWHEALPSPNLRSDKNSFPVDVGDFFENELQCDE